MEVPTLHSERSHCSSRGEWAFAFRSRLCCSSVWGGILAHALHSMSSPQCSHSCLVSTNAGSSEICLKHVSERISPKSAMDCIGYGDVGTSNYSTGFGQVYDD